MPKSRKTYSERCTFCGKSRHMVDSLVAGPPDVYICNDCVTARSTVHRRRNVLAHSITLGHACPQHHPGSSLQGTPVQIKNPIKNAK